MHIRHFEWIFSIDEVVPVDVLPVFWQILLQCYLSRWVFCRSHKFPCQSLLLSTTVLNHKELDFLATQVVIIIPAFVTFTECFL